MPASMKAFGLDGLSVEDRIKLAEEIRESVGREIDHSPLLEPQRAESVRRLADSLARPDAVIPREKAEVRWDEPRASPITDRLARAQACMTAMRASRVRKPTWSARMPTRRSRSASGRGFGASPGGSGVVGDGRHRDGWVGAGEGPEAPATLPPTGEFR